MIAQLISLFCFGLVVTFVVFLGILRARDVSRRERAERAAASARPRVVASGRGG